MASKLPLVILSERAPLGVFCPVLPKTFTGCPYFARPRKTPGPKGGMWRTVPQKQLGNLPNLTACSALKRRKGTRHLVSLCFILIFMALCLRQGPHALMMGSWRAAALSLCRSGGGPSFWFRSHFAAISSPSGPHVPQVFGVSPAFPSLVPTPGSPLLAKIRLRRRDVSELASVREDKTFVTKLYRMFEHV